MLSLSALDDLEVLLVSISDCCSSVKSRVVALVEGDFGIFVGALEFWCVFVGVFLVFFT